eukprot:COSAG03_NODE_215_length_10494_cov_13.007504_5_plen_347_part_00
MLSLVTVAALWVSCAAEEPAETADAADTCSTDPESCLGAAARPAPGIPALDELTPEQRQVLADHWVKNGLAEHASVASFARFTLQLMSVAAPAALVEASNLAGNDEIVHAKLCFGLAHKFGGKPMAPGPFPIPNGTVHIAADILEMAISVATEGCIGETLSVVRAAAQIELSHDPSVRQVLTRIAEDEARHAGLAWKTVRWALTQLDEAGRRTLAQALQRPFAPEPATPPETPEEEQETKVMQAYGVLSPYATRVYDIEHRDWLLPAMTKALLNNERVRQQQRRCTAELPASLFVLTIDLAARSQVKLKDDSTFTKHKLGENAPRRRSADVNLYVAKFLDIAGFDA